MVNEMGRMPVAEPYIKIVLVDFVYNGFCAMLSFKAMNQFLIDQGEANASENDFSYSLFIVLNVSCFVNLVLSIQDFMQLVTLIFREKICQKMANHSSSLSWREKIC